MSKKKPDNRSATPDADAPERPAAQRRKVLKRLAVAGGAIVAGKSMPDQWLKPVVDSVLMPAHAQATGGTIAANWVIGDDAPGSTTGIPVGVTNTSNDFLYDDGTTMFFYGQVSPPGATSLNVNVNVSGTNLPGFTGFPDSIAVNPATGDFTSTDFDESGDLWGDAPGTGSVTMTLSAPGYVNSVITLVLA